MFKTHFKVTLRQLQRNKVFFGLNIFGLSLGITLAVLIANFVKNENSYDHWMTDSDRTYRVFRIRGNSTAWTPAPLAAKLISDYPEVENATGWSPGEEQLITYQGKNFYVKATAQVDSTFFDVLPMPFLHGDAKTALSQPSTMVISDQLSQRVFGDRNPVGEVITFEGAHEFTIAGVIDRKGKNSHINSDLFIRFTYTNNYWPGNNRATYVRLAAGSDPKQLAQKVDQDVTALIRESMLADQYTPNPDDFFRWALQPLPAVYLGSEGFTSLGEAVGSQRNVNIFMLIAGLILLVAMINYINLTTARATQRGREIGVKKVAGAVRGMLASQFIAESVVQAFLAGILALGLMQLMLPLFNGITGRELTLLSTAPIWTLVMTFSIALLTGLVAGIYPALVMSGFEPARALKSNFMKTGDKGIFRKVLVTSQFAVSIILLVVMAFVYRQVNYMMSQDLGFQAEQILTIPMNSGNTFRRVNTLKHQFELIPGVQKVTTASSFPGGFIPDWGVQIEGRSERITPYNIYTDEDYADLLDIELLEGRFLSADIAADTVNNFVVNEEFVRKFQIENPVGTRIKWFGSEEYGQIVGVVQNFHFRGLASELLPIAITGGDWRNFVGVKISTQDIPATIKALESLWQQVEPTHPMRYTFLDESFAQQYADNQQFGQAILYAALLTVFIALLGLFGLTAFTVERRTREIGIRKVLGASVQGIIGLMAQDFVKLVGGAFLIAIPIAYTLSDQWLADFAYRTDLTWWIFPLAGLAVLGLGLLTVGAQSLKAAVTNPVESLRSE